MANKRLGKQTVMLSEPPSIAAFAAVGGKMESEGPLAAGFDYLSEDSYFGASSWESAESAMLKKCFDLAIKKSSVTADTLDYIFAGDLLNQCVGSAFAIKESNAPLFGLFGACSTMAESLSLAAMAIDGGFADTVCAMTSSHFCSAERQFRQPLSYGGQRTPTAQWTATAAGVLILSSGGSGPFVTHFTTGKIVDCGISDAANMGSAMAPAALETILTHLADTGRKPDYYDLIVTGDLGAIGHEILIELAQNAGTDLSKVCSDCGTLLYDLQKQDVHSGGSGCGCSAAVLAGSLLPKLKSGEIRRLLFAATGALMSPTTSLQGESILGICHAVSIESEKSVQIGEYMEIFLTYLKAFAVGGVLCAIGQILIDKTKITPARVLTSYVVAGVILGAIGIYEPLVKWAGAGASVPLTGFGNLLARGVREAVAEKGFVGIFTGGFTASSAGIASAVFFGLLVALIFKSKDKAKQLLRKRLTIFPECANIAWLIGFNPKRENARA